MNAPTLERNDRRRSLRVPATEGQTVPLHAGHSVRILDVGLGGALVQSRHPMPPGARGTLSFALGSTNVRLRIEVVRVECPEPLIYNVGTAFVGMTDEQREMLLRFVQR